MEKGIDTEKIVIATCFLLLVLTLTFGVWAIRTIKETTQKVDEMQQVKMIVCTQDKMQCDEYSVYVSKEERRTENEQSDQNTTS